MKFAAISKDNIVVKVFDCSDYETANAMSRKIYGDGTISRCVDDYDIKVGYLYDGGKFIDTNGKEILKNITIEDRLQTLEVELRVLKSRCSYLEMHNNISNYNIVENSILVCKNIYKNYLQELCSYEDYMKDYELVKSMLKNNNIPDDKINEVLSYAKYDAALQIESNRNDVGSIK